MNGDINGIVAMVTFWAFIAACVFIGAWKRKKIETLRHETARLLIEKNPSIDAVMLTQALNSPPQSLKSGVAFRQMKVAGTIVIALGLGLCVMGLCFAFIAGDKTALGLSGPAALLVILGAGILFAARFLPRPPAKDSGKAAETEVSKQFGNGSDI
jgi:hypothetical protein